MEVQENNHRVSAIVPAFNESERIGGVLDVLTSYPKFDEVIVVDDGSSDDTGEIANKFNVRYLKNEVNKGKGYSMDRGVAEANGDVIFFCDADVSGLRHRYIDEILKPVLKSEVDMCVAARDRTGNYLPFGSSFLPVGGERALLKRLWEWMPKYFKENFRVETGLNLYARYLGKGLKTIIFNGLTQTMKEKKYGLIEGIRQRWRLNVDLLQSLWRLLFVDSFDFLKSGRIKPVAFFVFWGTAFLRNLVISAAILLSWPILTIISPLLSRGKA